MNEGRPKLCVLGTGWRDLLVELWEIGEVLSHCCADRPVPHRVCFVGGVPTTVRV